VHLSDLQPYLVGPMHRVGSKNDGGYVIPKELPAIATLISFGVGDNWSFEKSCLKYGIVTNCIMYDHTVGLTSQLKKIKTRLLTPNFSLKSLLFRIVVAFRYLRDFSNHNLKHIKKEITRDQSSSSKTNLPEILKGLNETIFILKVDIEGDEYKIIEQIESFGQQIPLLLIEFHETDKYRASFEVSMKLLKDKFLICHTHANNYDDVSNDGIPKTVEVTFGNREYFKSNEKILELPVMGLDMPSTPNRSDIYLRF